MAKIASKSKTTSAKTDKPEEAKSEEISVEVEDAVESEDTTAEETPTTTNDSDDNKSGVVFTEKTNDNNKVKLDTLLVVTNRDHRCNIGGVWYDFEKGKPVSVPANVKTILKRAGLLAVI